MTSEEKIGMTPADVQDFRKKNQLTQKELGDLIGVSYQAVNFWEVGERRVPETTARLLKLLTKFPQLKDEL